MSKKINVDEIQLKKIKSSVTTSMSEGRLSVISAHIYSSFLLYLAASVFTQLRMMNGDVKVMGMSSEVLANFQTSHMAEELISWGFVLGIVMLMTYNVYAIARVLVLGNVFGVTTFNYWVYPDVSRYKIYVFILFNIMSVLAFNVYINEREALLMFIGLFPFLFFLTLYFLMKIRESITRVGLYDLEQLFN